MNPAGEGGAPRLFEVDRFEHLSASPERVLLRVDGRYVERPGRRILDATLFVDDGLAVRRHAALPDPGAADAALESWLWRAAFAVPASYLTDARMSFALEAEPGVLLALAEPRPVAVAATTQPLSARAAQTARRYAAAIAVMVTVAVAPGVIPANAGTEILKVRRADGSIVYLTSEGTPVSQIPADADIVDETAAAPAPSPPSSTVVASDSGSSQPATSAAAPAPAQPARSTGATPTRPRPAAPQRQTNSTVLQTDAPQTPAPHPRALGRRSAHRPRPHRHVAGAPAAAPAAPRAAAPDSELVTIPELAHLPARDTEHVTTPERAAHHSSATPALEPAAQIAADSSSPLKPLGALGIGPADRAPREDAPALTSLAPSSASSATLQPLDTPTPAPTQPPSLEALAATAPPASTDGSPQPRSGSRQPAPRPAQSYRTPPVGAPPLVRTAPAPAPPAPAAGAPTPAPSVSVPSVGTAPFVGLPSPTQSVPSLVISRFQIPPFLLPIYQAAATEYGIQWQVLAAINEIETDYGRDLSISSAGALGWMQFMPDTWKMYGVDANRDGKRDPYNPVDAIFAAARYLKAAGGDKDVRGAIFAYNHASWYVDSVMLRAELIAAYPPDLIGALTGLTQGRFPVAAPARYAGEVLPGKPAAAAADAPAHPEQGVDIYTQQGAPVVAVADGVVKRTGRSRTKGLYVVLQDAYGNEYTYSGLGEVAPRYPVPNVDAIVLPSESGPAAAPADPAPQAAATSGSQGGAQPGSGAAPSRRAAVASQAPIATKLRLFAHPQRRDDRNVGGSDQIFQARESGSGLVAYDGYFADPLGLNSSNATLRDLRPGATVVASTVLGRVGPAAPGQQPKIHFEVRPAGKRAPEIDPRPVLDGWRLLESTQAYGPSGKKALSSKDAGPITVGESMLLPKPLLEQRVLSDKRITIYAGGREDIKTGQIDRRVLEVLEYLAESGFSPTVTALKSGNGAPGSSSDLATGDAVDISAINGVPIAGDHQHGGITEQVVRRLMLLQGTLRPHEIVSQLSFGQNTVARPDHGDRIHVGFQPLFGDNHALAKAAQSVLGRAQWDQLANRLGAIGNPAVPTVPSRYALPDR